MVFLSALFVLSSITSLTLGTNSLINNPKHRLNRVFFILTSNISAWSFCYALMNIAKDVEMATAVHKTGALFYCSMYAIFLHLLILLTNSEKYFKTKAYHFLLYLPALISIWLYYFYKPVSTADHFKTSLGWVYVYPKYNNLFLDYFFPCILHFLHCFGTLPLGIMVQKDYVHQRKDTSQNNDLYYHPTVSYWYCN